MSEAKKRYVRLSRPPNAAAPGTPDMRMKDYHTEALFRLRRFLTGENAALLFILVCMVLARSVDQVLYYRMATQFQAYVWYLATIVLPIFGLVIGWPVVWYKMLYTTDITPAMRRFPQYKFCIMATFDTIYNLVSSWPIPYLSGSLVNVLNNVVLPMTMVGSILFLKTRYRASHYLGATLVVYGIMVKLLPSLFLGQNSNDGHVQNMPGLWITVLILSGAPAAASNVYKEIALKDTKMDVWYMSAWVTTWQLLLGLVTAPTVAIPFPKPAPVIELGHIPHYINDAQKCFFLGENQRAGDDCNGVLLLFVYYIGWNFAYNILTLVIFARGTSVLFTIASALRIPVVDMLLLWKWLAGPKTLGSLSVYDYYSLFGVVLGISVYYHKKEIHLREFAADKDPDLITDDDYEEASPNLIASPHVGRGGVRTKAPRFDGDGENDEYSELDGGRFVEDGAGSYRSFDTNDL